MEGSEAATHTHTAKMVNQKQRCIREGLAAIGATLKNLKNAGWWMDTVVSPLHAPVRPLTETNQTHKRDLRANSGLFKRQQVALMAGVPHTLSLPGSI